MNAAYEKKLTEFAKLVQGFKQAGVSIPQPDGSSINSLWLATEDNQSCNCCGTRRLKVRYPLIKKDVLLWVGKKCLTNLFKLGVIEEAIFPSYPMVEIREEKPASLADASSLDPRLQHNASERQELRRKYAGKEVKR